MIASIDGNGWAVIIGAMTIGVIQIMTAYRASLKVDALSKVADSTHNLVNSNMGEQLRLGADLSEFKANSTNNPEDIQAAKLARHRYVEHLKNQVFVDARDQ